jgi:hypothetical protein
MSVTNILGAGLVVEVALVFVAVAYIVRVYLESRRHAQGRVPLLYSIIAVMMAAKAVYGALIASILVGFWSGIDTRGWGSVLVGLVVMAMLSTAIIVALVIRHIRSEDDE